MMQISTRLEEIEDQLTEITYNVLCSERLSQMTKTYNDVEAVTRLLEEKERDLELAARIGQTLLEKNKALEDANCQLEEAISAAHERIAQLKHELSMKDELLRIYTQNYEGHESSPDGLTPTDSHGNTLQRKIKSLEDENLKLHLETTSLKATTDCLEEKEQKLVNDCVQQLEDVHQQLGQFARELADKTEESANQKEEITSLLSQIVTLQKKNRTLTMENMDLQKTLEAAHDSQNYLTREIAELKEKNEELQMYLDESQEEIRRLRSRDRPNAQRHQYMSSMSVPGDSLASELESSLRSEIDYPKGYSPVDRRKHTWKIFETAKAAKQAAGASSMCGSSSFLMPDSSCNLSMLGTSGIESGDSRSVSQRSSMYFSDRESESGVSEGYSGDVESLCGGVKKFGRPGVPGSHDLQRALRRLSMRRANELNEMDFANEEKERDRLERERTISETTEDMTPTRCRSPDSYISGGSGYISMGSSSNPYFRMPEKLRIVKPLEGSVTLRNWQRLATPHLGGIFEQRPGVQIKGETKLELEETEEEYRLSDYEEDDDDVMEPPVRFQESSGVYTYTDSTVRHPSEAARTSTSYTSSTPRVALGNSAQGSGTSTFSMSFGLASILNERDLLKTPPEGALNPAYRSTVTSSNPDRFPSLFSDTHYTTTSTPATTLTLLTNNYNLIPAAAALSQRSDKVSEDGSRSQVTEVTQSAPVPGTVNTNSTTETTSPSSLTKALSMINKLKSSGLSMYGYISGGLTSPEPLIENDTTSLPRPNSLPLPSASTSTTVVAMATSTSAVVSATSTSVVSTATSVSGASGGSEDLVTAGTTTITESPKKLTLTSLLSHRATGGVIGALTSIRKDGIL